jgi:hypothetical protein
MAVFFALFRRPAYGSTDRPPLAARRQFPASKYVRTIPMSRGANKLDATIAELAEAFPRRLPLIRHSFGHSSSASRMTYSSRPRFRTGASRRLRSYCNSLNYLRASTEGAVRIDLAGSASGTVTATEAGHAREALAAICKKTAKRESKIASATSALPSRSRAGKQSSPAVGTPKGTDTGGCSPGSIPPAPGPKRLSLSDLRLAAAARKAKR